MLDKKEHTRWLQDNGDVYHNLNYDLNLDSKIMDLGGYTGEWAQQLISRFNPNVFIIEPMKAFHDGMVDRFKFNHKVHLMNVGIGVEDKNGVLYIDNDMTSSSRSEDKESVEVKFLTMDTILKNFGIDEIDLLQMNIEGDEYAILEHMLQTGTINKIKNIQIQFHLDVPNAIEKRKKIRKQLIDNGFRIKFDYAFVWEGWTKIN
jgi:FkbM family methyltransferase